MLIQKVFKQDQSELFVGGFIIFINVNEDAKATLHNLEIVPRTDTDKELYEKSQKLKEVNGT